MALQDVDQINNGVVASFGRGFLASAFIPVVGAAIGFGLDKLDVTSSGVALCTGISVLFQAFAIKESAVNDYDRAVHGSEIEIITNPDGQNVIEATPTIYEHTYYERGPRILGTLTGVTAHAGIVAALVL